MQGSPPPHNSLVGHSSQKHKFTAAVGVGWVNCLFFFFKQRQSLLPLPPLACSFPADFSPFTQEGAGAHGTARLARKRGRRERQKSGCGVFQGMAPALPARGFRYSACTPDAEIRHKPHPASRSVGSGPTCEKGIGLAGRVSCMGSLQEVVL